MVILVVVSTHLALDKKLSRALLVVAVLPAAMETRLWPSRALARLNSSCSTWPEELWGVTIETVSFYAYTSPYRVCYLCYLSVFLDFFWGFFSAFRSLICKTFFAHSPTYTIASINQ